MTDRKERCVNCGAPIPRIVAPIEHPELSGSLMCNACARKKGMPTLGPE